jgi:hypothetical protein
MLRLGRVIFYPLFFEVVVSKLIEFKTDLPPIPTLHPTDSGLLSPATLTNTPNRNGIVFKMLCSCYT